MKKNTILIYLTSMLIMAGCNGYDKTNNSSQLFLGIILSTTSTLNPLVITASDSSSITLAQPTLYTSGNPTPTVTAYIGINGVISISGSTVTGNLCLPLCSVDVSAGGTTFNGLTGNTTYRIVVVAQNSSGYSVAQIVQATGGIAAVMDPLVVINPTDNTNITVQQPTYSTAGFPLPATNAYIGLDGTITVSPLGVVSFSTDGPYNVFGANHTFTGLAPNTAYRIIVVASNASGVSIRQITQDTAPSAPVMNPLVVINPTDNTNITVQQPTYSTAGFPLPVTANAYIGLDGTITVTPAGAVGGFTDGPYNVFGANHTFTGLTPNTAYRIIVVVSNASGVSIRQITQDTAPSAPVMNPLVVINPTDNTNITVQQPTYSTAGFPLPVTANAYIGLDGTITVTPAGAVGGFTDGPYNVFGANHTFTGLTPNTAYRIIVVVSNASGVSIRQIIQNTAPSPPVMDPLNISAFDANNITLDQVSFLPPGSPGFPLPLAANAYIGLDGTITVTPAGAVGGFTDGPYNVFGANHTFMGLTPNTTYRIIVVASNASGVSIRQIVQTTAP